MFFSSPDLEPREALAMCYRPRSQWSECGVEVRKLGCWVGACVVFAGAVVSGAGGVARGDDVNIQPGIAQGRELFTREWVPGDPGRRSGDGLGPMYNDTSCVACHNQGGVGGGGPASKNVDLLTAVVTPVAGEPGHQFNSMSEALRIHLNAIPGGQKAEPPKPRVKGEAADRKPLVEFHGGFRNASSLVVHRFGPDANYESRRSEILDPFMRAMRQQKNSMLRQPAEADAVVVVLKRDQPRPFPNEHGHFTLIQSQRNPAPLFGVGLIDSVPDAVLEAAATQAHGRFPEIKGRVCRLADGRIGRFGWKAEQASLEDFVLTACAVELGLEVPGRHQGVKPDDPDYRAPGLDLTGKECGALAEFIGSLPAPDESEPATERESQAIQSGRTSFERIGCAACHRPKLGATKGIYSDLLLHDLGDSLGNAGSYGSRLLDPAARQDSVADAGLPQDPFTTGPPRPTPALRREWRTPPLWGIRDSGPYLHDGRAETLEQAIALHGGEALMTRNRYFQLSREARIEVQSFLKSLVAPRTREARPPQRGLDRHFLTLAIWK
jgi:CxxC motif-containing protein (DUF1111 family)